LAGFPRQHGYSHPSSIGGNFSRGDNDKVDNDKVDNDKVDNDKVDNDKVDNDQAGNRQIASAACSGYPSSRSWAILPHSLSFRNCPCRFAHRPKYEGSLPISSGRRVH